ncbi:hypothetical protein [Kitasatospora sp. NPDC093806]|uniref:hypothetical protein n=1 Tax=Kitasatospora sp. NPDC093806 TaxID=3155075 RepID=UPI00342E0FFD
MAAVAAVPLLVLGLAGSASGATADNAAVSWSTTDGTHNFCLAHDSVEPVSLMYVPTMTGTCMALKETTWRDDNSNLKDPDPKANFYAEKTPGPNGRCLTAFWQGQIYLEPCSNPVNYYEQWDEESFGGHWILKNRMINRCLAHPGFNLAMKDCDARDSEQYWS